jgi:NADPH:quinone reductase-like Zn-dependent oxidoreductase
VPIPKLKKNEVLIKIECSPLNPMDLSFIKGSYSSVKKLPATPGFEASGTVVASGGNFLLILRKVDHKVVQYYINKWYHFSEIKSKIVII